MSGIKRFLRRTPGFALLAVGGAGDERRRRRVAEPAQAATAITINGTSGGRTFDGVGAISGGGGNSRLLIDYPEPQRGQILDYLFKPGYGAAAADPQGRDRRRHQLHRRRRAQPRAHPRRPQLRPRATSGGSMEQAKARNPNIKLVGLAWGAPGWIGNGNFWSQRHDRLPAWPGWAAPSSTA